MTNLKEIEKTAEKFDNSIDLLNKELKRVASIKSRLKKQKGRSDYSEKMTETLSYYQVLVEAKNLIEPKKKTCFELTKEDIDLLDFDETMKAIKAIQSKKTNSAWETDAFGDNDTYRKACEIEKLLLEHKETVKPVADEYIRKTDLMNVIETIKASGKVSQNRILEMLESLI